MPSLSSLLVAALLAASPMSERRADQIARAIEPALSESAFPGPAGKLATGVALVAIGQHEGGWRVAVETCRVTGDNGASFTVFQINRASMGRYTPEMLCGSPTLAALRARELLTWHARNLKRPTPRALFRAYAGPNHKAADETCAIWERLAKHVGLVGAKCGKRMGIWRKGK